MRAKWTDLAVEAAGGALREKGLSRTVVKVENEESAQKLGRPMGTYVTLNGLGAAAAPAAIGVAANHGGIRVGFALLLIAAAMLVVSALCNMRYLKKR